MRHQKNFDEQTSAAEPESSSKLEDIGAVDRHIGIQIRLQRQHEKMSQAALGEKIGVTFQQIQKYERGANRVSSSVLYEIACILEKPIDYFFEGLPRPEREIELDASGKSADRAAARSIDHLSRMPPGVRSTVLELIEAIANRDS
ncbi:helix-turn-helix domain-containing protein [Agrobacterium tumefaciens]|uniref:Helix-turn-helix transcriptional regulator n=1 Tax=Agrobacterium tumefaciens TaxID=358 RepID=A0AA44F9H0_AGRTU|nr:helix-turn-helix transcriptional regulator [Agrobacterium tumefaciens]NTC32059.1 helix-turn-helix transcriptional regulator [Agrobacterium tumefaciens]